MTVSVSPSMGRAALSGSLWTAFAFVVNKGVALVSVVVLARLLDPAEFGIVTVGLVVVAFGEVVADAGLGSAVVLVRGSPTVMRAAVTIAAASGTAMTLLGVLLAPAFASMFGEPAAAPYLAVLSLVLLPSAVRQVFAGTLARDLRFRRRVVPDTARALVKASVTIAAALAGAGAWSLVIGQLAGTLADLVAFVAVTGGRLRPGRVGRSDAGALLGQGWRLMLVTLIGVALQNVDYVAIGARGSGEALGVYAVAFKIPEVTLMALPFVAGQALLPVYARMDRASADRTALVAGVAAAMRGVGAVAVPLSVCLAVFARELVLGVFGEPWIAAAPVLRFLALYGLFGALAYNIGDAMKAAGGSGLLVRLGAVRLVVTVPAMWWAAAHGIETVARVQAVLAGAVLVASIGLAASVFGVRWRPLAASLTVPLISGAVMLVVAVAVRSTTAAWSPLVAAAVGGTAALVAYGASTMALDRAWVRSVLALRSA